MAPSRVFLNTRNHQILPFVHQTRLFTSISSDPTRNEPIAARIDQLSRWEILRVLFEKNIPYESEEDGRIVDWYWHQLMHAGLLTDEKIRAWPTTFGNWLELPAYIRRDLHEKDFVDRVETVGSLSWSWSDVMELCEELQEKLNLRMDVINADRARRAELISEAYEVAVGDVEETFPPNAIDRKNLLSYDLRLMGRNALGSSYASLQNVLSTGVKDEVIAIVGAAGTSKTSSVLASMHRRTPEEAQAFLFYINLNGLLSVADPIVPLLRRDVSSVLKPLPPYKEWEQWGQTSLWNIVKENNQASLNFLLRDLLARSLLLHTLLQDDNDVTPVQFKNVYFSHWGYDFIQNMYLSLRDCDDESLDRLWRESNERLDRLKYKYAVVVDEADKAAEFTEIISTSSFPEFYTKVINAIAPERRVSDEVKVPYARGLCKPWYQAVGPYCPFVVVGTGLSLTDLYFAGSDDMQKERMRIYHHFGVLSPWEVRKFLKNYSHISEKLSDLPYFWLTVRPRLTEMLIEAVYRGGVIEEDIVGLAKRIEGSQRNQRLEKLRTYGRLLSFEQLCGLLARSSCFPPMIEPLPEIQVLRGELQQAVEEYTLYEFCVRAGLTIGFIDKSRYIGITEMLGVDSLAEYVHERCENRSGSRVLSLDGGGARVIIAVRVLRYLEHQVGKRMSSLFDVVAGTSGGGILALAILLDLSADEMRDALVNMSSSVMFEKNLWKWKLADIKKFFASSTEVAERLNTSFASSALPGSRIEDLDPILQTYTHPTTIITSIFAEDETTYLPVCFSNDNKVPYHEKLSSVSVAATSSIMNCIEQRTDTGYFVDGGYWMNNPSLLALEQASRIQPGLPSMFLSIGSGKPLPRLSALDRIMHETGARVVGAHNVSGSIATDSEITHQRMKSVFHFQDQLRSHEDENGPLYYRVNPDLGKDLNGCISLMATPDEILRACDVIDEWISKNSGMFDPIVKELLKEKEKH